MRKNNFGTNIYDLSHSGRDGKSWYKHHHHALAKPHHWARIFAKAPVIIDVGVYWKFYFQNCTYFKFVWFDFIRFPDPNHIIYSIQRFWISANILSQLKIDIMYQAAVRLLMEIEYRHFFFKLTTQKRKFSRKQPSRSRAVQFFGGKFMWC